MTEKIDLTGNDKNAEGQPEERVVMQLTIDKEGNLKVYSPMLGDKTAMYGLLEVARDAIQDLHKPKIQKHIGGIMGFARNGKH